MSSLQAFVLQSQRGRVGTEHLTSLVPATGSCPCCDFFQTPADQQ